MKWQYYYLLKWEINYLKMQKVIVKKSRDVIDGISTSNVLFIYISILSNVDIVVDEFHDFLSVVA